ncbi:MAG: CpsD/CapB family tyrosine-protein kinase [Phycisphaeraceae bacterium]|nr:CpsD/CapB family tyrosine-protein kinase [Phycisphaeraceae bacterium]
MGYVFDAIHRHDDDDTAPRRSKPAPARDAAVPVPPKTKPTPQINIPAAATLKFTGTTSPAQATAAVSQTLADAPAALVACSQMDKSQLDDRLVALLEPSSLMAEEYRAIRTSLLARWQQRRNLVHTITSATPQEGKTITSMNLGLTFSELRNCKICVVEADLRLPTFDKLLGRTSQVGLLQYLRGEAQINQIIQRLDDHPLRVISAGGRTQGDAVQLLSSGHFSQLLQHLRQRYDHVIVDTPPVVELADAGIIGAQSDDVMLVVRMNRTPRTLIEQAIRTLASYNAPVAGAIATDHSHHRHKYYYYRYGYRYGYRYSDYVKKAA